MESIRLWLNGDKNYKTGVKLYLQFGSDALLKRLFYEEEQTAFKTKKLQTALEDILHKKKKNVEQEIIIHEKQVEKLQAERIIGKGWRENMDETESAIYNKWKPVFKEMMDLCTRLDAVAREGIKVPASKDEAGRIALRILDLDDACDELYEKRDYYHQHGNLPDENPYGELCIDSKLMPLKLANHKRYTREFKLKLKAEPDNIKAAQMLKKHQWYVKEYCKLLNLPYEE